MTRSDQHGRLHPLSKTRRLSTETTLVSPFVIQRQQVRWHVETNMVISSLSSKIQCLSMETTLVSPRHPETIKSDDTWRQTTVIPAFANQRQSSSIARRDQYGHLLFSSKTQCLTTGTTLVSILSTKGKQARWHAETFHGYSHPCYPETIESDSKWRQLMIIRTFVI